MKAESNTAAAGCPFVKQLASSGRRSGMALKPPCLPLIAVTTTPDMGGHGCCCCCCCCCAAAADPLALRPAYSSRQNSGSHLQHQGRAVSAGPHANSTECNGWALRVRCTASVPGTVGEHHTRHGSGTHQSKNDNPKRAPWNPPLAAGPAHRLIQLDRVGCPAVAHPAVRRACKRTAACLGGPCCPACACCACCTPRADMPVCPPLQGHANGGGWGPGQPGASQR